MKKPPHRLNTVLKLAVLKEQKEAATLAQLNRQFQNQQQRKEQLRQYGQEYRQQLTSNGQKGITASMYKSHSEFIGHIQTSLNTQHGELINLEHDITEQKKRWHDAHTKVKSLQRAIEKDVTAQTRKRERREEISADEWAQQRSNTRNN